ncbi:hypothetical protein D3C76_1604300 [compost metagenome]
MATSYADSAQAREWDRRYDAWGREKRPQSDDFHDYEAVELKRSQALIARDARLQAESQASAKRVRAALEQLEEFWGTKES